MQVFASVCTNFKPMLLQTDQKVHKHLPGIRVRIKNDILDLPSIV